MKAASSAPAASPWAQYCAAVACAYSWPPSATTLNATALTHAPLISAHQWRASCAVDSPARVSAITYASERQPEQTEPPVS